METWDELYNEQANIVLIALTYFEFESDSDSSLESKEDQVFYKLSCSNLITFIKDLMSRCQEKAKHMKINKAIRSFERRIKICAKQE